MLASVQSMGLMGIQGYPVTVEAYCTDGMPMFEIVGLPDAAVKEARERVRSAIKTNGMKFPVSRLTVNLAPADTRKAGTLYDLPVLLGILCATGEIRQPPATAAFFGEVSLAGEIRPVTGALTMALAAEQLGLRELFVPAGNAAEAAFAEGVTVYPVENISQLVHHLRGEKPIAPMSPPDFAAAPHFAVDFAEVKAQENVKRALEDIINLHAAGTKAMMSAALEGLTRPDGTRPLLIAVTQLTSTDQERMEQELLIHAPIDEVVLHYARNARDAGLDGVVCSPLEAGSIHARCGADFLTVTPGVRFADGESGDQKRVTTPERARELGSDYIVVGRPITQADDPVAAYRRCVAAFVG